MTKVFKQVEGYKVRPAYYPGTAYKWILWRNFDDAGRFEVVGRFKTKREANRAIPMVECTDEYQITKSILSTK